jgi:hypothetical protein
MRSGNLTLKIVRSNNPQTRDYYRINSAYNTTYSNSVHKTGDILEVDLLDNIDIINRIIKHDRFTVTVATEGRNKIPVVNADTMQALDYHYGVYEDNLL